MQPNLDRRNFLKQSASLGTALATASLPCRALAALGQRPLFTISLAEWSLHRAFRAHALENLDFPVVARRDYDIDAVEYVNQFFMDKAQDQKYLGELKKRAAGEGVRNQLIMCDREGALGDADATRRQKAVENHYKWVEAAKFLGCHSIRVNAQSSGSYDEQMDRAAEGLRHLSEFAAKVKLNVIVENHGGLSSNGAWVAAVIRKVNLTNCGTLPDFGNFDLKDGTQYDRYKGVAEMMPFAKAVSAKTYDFDANGNETRIDYGRMLRIVLAAGYHDRLGIEYEGNRLGEPDGIRATKALLDRVRDELR